MITHGVNRRALLIYVGLGTALSLARVALLIYVNHRMVSHTMSDTVYRFGWILYPEALVLGNLPFGVLGIKALYYTAFSLLLTLGSFILALPVLFLKRSNL